MKKVTRRNFIVGLASLPAASQLSLAASKQSKRIYIGTYTRKSSQGVYVYRWKPRSGEMEQIGLAAKTPNPSFLTLSPNRNNLYCVNEQDHTTGNVSAFAIDHATGKLTPENVVPSGGSAPCNLTTDHTGQALFVANYGSGSVSSYKILSGGSPRGLSQPVSNIFFKGHSIDPERQQHAHTHCTTVSPENKFLLVNDLGLDRIMVFHFDPKTAKLTPNDPPYYSATPGSGPRNLTFHPNGKWAYSIAEMGSIIECMDWNGDKGTLTRFQVISSLPKEHKSPTDAATVQVHPNGRFLFGSNRGDDSITSFSIAPANGHLTLLQRISCEGGSPRHFAVAPDGRWLVIGNQDTANIVILKCDPDTGKLASTGRQYPLDSPVCVVFD
ncbi:MAG TPA: lactonase family protein [Acidobacteriaceae bacterium]|nr:lactonase family protein [Acidobacteriaceae bacterium]